MVASRSLLVCGLLAAASGFVVPAAHRRHAPRLRAAAKDDGGLGQAIDAAASEMASAPAIAAATLPANRRSLALWRVGWCSWWSQVILSVISAVVLVFARVSTPATANSVAGALGNGFLFASLGAGFAFASVAWTWRLTRLARLEPASAATPDLAYVLRKTRGALRFGATLNLFGMALTLVSAEQVVGMLIAKALVAPGALTNIVSAGGAIAAPSIPAVTALDVFVVQANTNTLCAHFASLLATLGLLSRSDKW
ncbi:hypothetical protein SO694_00026342 [Aureococcus anophagefferens]|uniref:DUF3611 family protein n=1 Tax=Aureococcus anophagefferens TaxID=44056 RepID=A0ABR1FUU4_AURAN